MHKAYQTCPCRVHVCMVPGYLVHACPSAFRPGVPGACIHALASNKSKTISFPVKPAARERGIRRFVGTLPNLTSGINPRLNNNVFSHEAPLSPGPIDWAIHSQHRRSGGLLWSGDITHLVSQAVYNHNPLHTMEQWIDGHIKGIPVGRPLFQGGKEERLPSCHHTLWLGTDEQGLILVTLSSFPYRTCILVHISVADVVPVPLTTVTGRFGLYGSGWPMIGWEVARSDHLHPVEASRHKSIW